jgi:hypothetical protein
LAQTNINNKYERENYARKLKNYNGNSILGDENRAIASAG